MNAPSPVIDSAASFLSAIPTGKPYEMTRRTLRVIVLDFALPEQPAPSESYPLQARARSIQVFLLAVSSAISEEGRKVRPIRAEPEIYPGKICRRFEHIGRSWVYGMIFALLTSCCAIIFFFAFQAPFRLRVNEDLPSPEKFRSETAALPATLKTQAMSRFRAHGSPQNAGYHKTDNRLDDSPHKSRAPRERPFQQRQSQVSIRPGQFSGQN
jgi:hypothetical protein